VKVLFLSLTSIAARCYRWLHTLP